MKARQNLQIPSLRRTASWGAASAMVGFSSRNELGKSRSARTRLTAATLGCLSFACNGLAPPDATPAPRGELHDLSATQLDGGSGSADAHNVASTVAREGPEPTRADAEPDTPSAADDPAANAGTGSNEEVTEPSRGASQGSTSLPEATAPGAPSSTQPNTQSNTQPHTESDTQSNTQPSPASASSTADSPSVPPPDPVRTYAEPTPLEPALTARTWRLTTEQYVASVNAMVGAVPDVSLFAPALDNGVFPNFSSSGLVRLDQANAYAIAAQQVADGVSVEYLINLGGGCTPDATCRDAFVHNLLTQAFRRTPTDAELATYTSLFDAGLDAGDIWLAYRTVIKAVLTAPLFLYRTEIGAAQDETETEFTLTNDEVATLLAFSVTGEAPSAELREAAAAGEMLTPQGLAAALARLLQSTAAEQQFRRFVEQWLEVHTFSTLTKFENVYPGFAAAQGLIWDETEAYLKRHGAFGSTFDELLTARSDADDLPPELVAFYSSDPSGAELGPRFGLLSLGSVLASHSNPTLTSPTARGVFVRRRMLCENLPPPPVGIPPLSDTQATGLARTTRELFEQHTANSVCANCHRFTDPVGFVFENFDGAGRYRTLDTTQGANEPVDASGKLIYTDVNGPLSGPQDLASALAQSAFVRECASVQAFRFYFGQAEPGLGLPPIVASRTALGQTGLLGDWVTALMTTESTFKRRRD